MQRPNYTEIHKQAHQNFNRHDMESAARNAVDNFTYKDRAQGIEMNSRQEFIDYLEGWISAFSDARISDPTYIDGGDKVVAIWTAYGTNDGPFGDFPATGKKIETPICEILHFNEEGKMVSGELYYDRMTMLEQLGHVKEGVKQ